MPRAITPTMILLVLSHCLFLWAEDKPCPQINTTTSDGDFTLRQVGGRKVSVDLEHPHRKPRNAKLVQLPPVSENSGYGTQVKIGNFYYDIVESCFYTTAVSNGYGTLTSKSGREVGAQGANLWITVRGLKHHREWTCHLLTFDAIDPASDKWKIGDVLWFNATNISKDDSSIPNRFQDCNEISNLTQDYPSQVPK
jgi:hypothetical protein